MYFNYRLQEHRCEILGFSTKNPGCMVISVRKCISKLHSALAFMSPQTFSFPRFKISNKVIKTTYSKEVKEKMSQFFFILLNPILAQVQYKATVFVSLQVRDT